MKAMADNGQPARRAQGNDPNQLSERTRLDAKRKAADSFATLQEIVIAARRNLSRPLWDMLSGGSDSETTLRRNRLGSIASRFGSACW
jgi:hypothetical protein